MGVERALPPPHPPRMDREMGHAGLVRVVRPGRKRPVHMHQP